MALKPLILASTSKYRKELLERLRTPFKCEKPLIDEDELKKSYKDLTPQKIAETLALAKAKSIAQNHPDALVVGSDQLVHFEGEILGKQGDFESACAQLAKLSGRTHELITSVAIVSGTNETVVFTDITHLTLRSLSPKEIESYVLADKPYDCAGSYKFESYGISLLDRLETNDPTAIVGLPLIELQKHLSAMT